MYGTTLEDLIGIEHTKLGFFEQSQRTVEQLKRTNQALKAKQKEVQALLDGITDLMVVLSEDMRILSVNHVFKQIFGQDDPCGKHCFEVFRQESEICPDCPARKAMKEQKVHKAQAILKVQNKHRHFDILASPLQYQTNGMRRVLLFKRDVTLEKEFQAQYYQAEKMATIGVLAAGVAHEINNPLTAVRGFSQAMQRRLKKPESLSSPETRDDFKEYTHTILNECERCQEIVQTLLTFSRPKASRFTPLIFNYLVHDTLVLLHHIIKHQPCLKLKTELSDDIPSICGDEPQLKQVILNLLTNAMDAVKKNKKGEIHIRTYADPEDGVVLEVEDNGCGIDPKNVEKLFEPFFTTKPVGEGTGIGLSTCYNIVKHHNGEIYVNSEPEKGSLFKVIIPEKKGRYCEQPLPSSCFG